MNWLKREYLLEALDATEQNYLSLLNSRLIEPRQAPVRCESAWTRKLPGFYSLPTMRHQPRDRGRYLTSFITALRDDENKNTNTGFYRVYIKNDKKAVIFMDKRTHAHAIVSAALRTRKFVPVTLFAGGALAHYLTAASTIPRELDSFEAACRLAARPLPLTSTGVFPHAPSDAEIVIHGMISAELDEEAPFGEFKGCYCDETRSHVLELDSVTTRPDAYYPGLFCGKESGLTLMSMSNEMLMFGRLKKQGFDVRQVRYPLAALGEFLTIVEADTPNREIADAALEADPRTKIVVVTQRVKDALIDLSRFNFSAWVSQYVKHNKRYGDRVAAVVTPMNLDRVEY
jgi:UbiD family decarboxylase